MFNSVCEKTLVSDRKDLALRLVKFGKCDFLSAYDLFESKCQGKKIFSLTLNICMAFLMLMCIQIKAADIEVVMAGVGGNTSGEMVARLQSSVLSQNPDLVIVLAGTNDVLNLDKLTPIDSFEINMNYIVDQIQANNSEVLLMTIPPCNEALWLSDKTAEQKAYYAPDGPNGRIDQFNAIIKKISVAKNTWFLDMNGVFGTNYSLLSPRVGDAVHPTNEGYSLMADTIYKFIMAERLPMGKIVCLGNSITTHYPYFLEDRLLADVPCGGFDAFLTIDAKTYCEHKGGQKEACAEGGTNVGSIKNNDWLRFDGVDFGNGPAGFEARVASDYAGGTIELRLGSSNGKLIGTATVGNTGGWQNWVTVTGDVSGVEGTHDLFLVFKGGPNFLLNINWFKFKY